MNGFPLRYARRNLLIGRGGEAAALYRARSISFPFLPVSDKWSQLGRLEAFATLVGADFSLWRVQRSYPAEGYSAELLDTCDPVIISLQNSILFFLSRPPRSFNLIRIKRSVLT